MLALVGLAGVGYGLVMWRHGERINRWFIHRLPWWTGAGWHADNIDKAWYRAIFIRVASAWFVAIGMLMFVFGALQLVRP